MFRHQRLGRLRRAHARIGGVAPYIRLLAIPTVLGKALPPRGIPVGIIVGSFGAK